MWCIIDTVSNHMPHMWTISYEPYHDIIWATFQAQILANIKCSKFLVCLKQLNLKRNILGRKSPSWTRSYRKRKENGSRRSQACRRSRKKEGRPCRPQCQARTKNRYDFTSLVLVYAVHRWNGRVHNLHFKNARRVVVPNVTVRRRSLLNVVSHSILITWTLINWRPRLRHSGNICNLSKTKGKTSISWRTLP